MNSQPGGKTGEKTHKYSYKKVQNHSVVHNGERAWTEKMEAANLNKPQEHRVQNQTEVELGDSSPDGFSEPEALFWLLTYTE